MPIRRYAHQAAERLEEEDCDAALSYRHIGDGGAGHEA